MFCLELIYLKLSLDDDSSIIGHINIESLKCHAYIQYFQEVMTPLCNNFFESYATEITQVIDDCLG